MRAGLRIAAAILAGLAAAAAQAQPATRLASIDPRIAHYVWKPEGRIAGWIVSLHGTRGSAQTDLGVWRKNLGGRPIGILAIQWWIAGEQYLSPPDLYVEIDRAVRAAGIAPGRVLLHGFSRGSANLYAVAALDAGQRRKLFSFYVASSGGAALDYPPTRAIVDGLFGARPLAGTRWVTACGGRDPNPERDGCPGMRRTGQWLKEQGATLLEAIEDPQSGHGALQLDPRNAARVLDLLLR